MKEQIYAFLTAGTPSSCISYGSGHINETYLISDNKGGKYILQKINRHVFKNVEGLMANIVSVTDYLRKSTASSREALQLIKTRDGGYIHYDSANDAWRLYVYIENSLCLNKVESPEDFAISARAFGRFQEQLKDFPAETLVETIPNFHNTPLRYQHFHQVLKADPLGRAKTAQREIDALLSWESYAPTLVNLQNAGALPLRVTHNDTKLNNILLDKDTRQALCIIDLDTVMPGLSANDFGDAIRFGASTGAEDEPDLDKVTLSLPLFRIYAEGYLSACRASLTPMEIACLRDGAKMMTLESGVRFLTDYLDGDHYFHTQREKHNLDRARTQIKLVQDMDKKWNEMEVQ